MVETERVTNFVNCDAAEALRWRDTSLLVEAEVGDDAGFLAELTEAEDTPIRVGRFGGGDIDRSDTDDFVELLILRENGEEAVGSVTRARRVERLFR